MKFFLMTLTLLLFVSCQTKPIRRKIGDCFSIPSSHDTHVMKGRQGHRAILMNMRTKKLVKVWNTELTERTCD